MRINAPATKVGYLVAVVVVVALTVIPLAAINFELGFVSGTVLVVAAVVVAARTFRGSTESDVPRPWWKMTSTRGSGFLLSALFVIQGISAFVGASASANPSLAVTGGLIALVIAALYSNSAIKTQSVAAST